MDIFISYKKEEKAFAARMSRRLTEAGFRVWWDAALLSGQFFEEEIAAALKSSKAVIILWSRQSVKSKWVQAEANSALSESKALPVIIDDLPHAELPLLFRGLHCQDLAKWRGDADHAGFNELLAAVRARVGEPGPILSPLAAEADLEASATEAELWAEISGATPQSAEEYRGYLTRFGSDARFAEIANVRIARLERQSKRPRVTRLTIVLATLLVLSVGLLASSLIVVDNASGQTVLDRTVAAVSSAVGLAPPPKWIPYYNMEYGFEVLLPPELKSAAAPVGEDVRIFQSSDLVTAITAGANTSDFAAEIGASRNASRD